jgi:hypothetical protein
MQPIAEGMSQWSEPQLRLLEEDLGRFDFCADGNRSLRSECFFFGDRIIEYVRRAEDKPNLMGGFSRGGGGQPFGLDMAGVLMTVTPEGWFDFEHLNQCRMTEDYLLPTIDPTNRVIRPSATRRFEAGVADLSSRSAPALFVRHRMFCGLLLPNFPRAANRMAFGQTAADCSAVACALELYRRQHGQYPGALAALAPEFIPRLPHDVINGQPLIYSRTEDGRYVLYSVGWNEIDDGGKVDLGNRASTEWGNRGAVESEPGDWVWRPRETPPK